MEEKGTALKADAMELVLADSLQDIGRKLQRVAGELKASVNQIQSSSGGLAQFDDHADIEVVFEGTNFMGSFGGGKYWAVQVYVFDEGNRRRVELVVVGDSGLSRALKGGKNATSMGAGRAKRDQIITALRS